MRYIILLLCLFFGVVASPAQNVIAVQNGGSSQIATTLDSALALAQPGDTLFLSGGMFAPPSSPIDKTVHLVGVGHDPDSSQATGKTIIADHLIFISGADHSSVTGIHVEFDIVLGTNSSDQQVSYLTVDRCNVRHIKLSYTGSTTSNTTGHSVRGCVLRGGLLGGKSTNGFFSNNFVSGNVWSFGDGCEFLNNVFAKKTSSFSSTCYVFSSITFATFRNNVVLAPASCNIPGSGAGPTVKNSYFLNNLFVNNGVISNSNSTGNDASNSIINQPIDSIFIHLPNASFGNSITFSYQHDYNIANPLGHNHGTDGTDIGVYGGVYAWKEGHIPFNPHVQVKAISPNTNNAGMLNVKVRVKAQDY
ncbi:MAG: hypothetical protein AAF587_35635 [Bacteroidota bacterium]